MAKKEKKERHLKKKMFRRSPRCLASMKEVFGTKGNPFAAYMCKEYFMFGFIGSFTYLTVFSVQETKKAGPTDLPPEVLAERARQNDPRRPPWPILHQRVVQMREGKAPHDDISLLWEQTKHYYPHDWLIPLELSQILKYTTGKYLQSYVADPDQLRREVLQQLSNIAEGRIRDPAGIRLNRDTLELIALAAMELEDLDLTVGMTLVPRNT